MNENRSGFVVLNAGEAAHPDLALWHGNIGQPVALDVAPPLPHKTTVIDVLSWNIAIGLGRLEQVVDKVRTPNRPLVVLVQEAYRADDTVPHEIKSPHHGGKYPRNARIDIIDMANELGFSLRYAPSMRNGRHRSDRGNAILSSVSIAHARAFALPHVRQLRVAVAAEVHGLPWLTFVCAHLDTRGNLQGSKGPARYSAGRMAQADALAKKLVSEWGDDQTVVIGADLNTYFGTREPLLRGFLHAGFKRIPHEPLRSHTFHARPLRMLLDHILVRGDVANVSVRRIDDDPLDRGKTIFGSDHHPLLATIELPSRDRRLRR